jgi:hypothetical protein
MIIEADFTESDDTFVFGEATEVVDKVVGRFGGVIGMDSDGSPDGGIFRGKIDGVAGGLEACADGDHLGNTGFVGAGNDFRAIGIEIGEVDVGVGVDEVHGH